MAANLDSYASILASVIAIFLPYFPGRGPDHPLHELAKPNRPLPH